MNKKLTMIALAVVLGWACTSSAALVGWWKFNEGSGNIAGDSSGQGLDASIEGPIWVEGQSGSALEFNGTDSLVRIPEFTTGPVQTVAAWIKIDSVQGGGRQIFNGNGPPHMNFEVFDGQIKGRVYTGSGNLELVGPEVSVGVWTHLAWVWDFGANRSELYIDGESVALGEASNTIEHTSESIIGRHPSATTASFLGAIDEMRIYDHALDLSEIRAAMKGNAALSSSPTPQSDAVDVVRDVRLAWKPGEFAVKHNVYLGTVFADVNNADTANSMGVLISEGQDANAYDAGVFDFGQTYYWRVDEVNGAPDNTVFKGEVWGFEVEPFSIPVETITATASSSHATDMGPANTINGIGLNELDQHSTESTEMWLSGMGDPAPSIQYAFDKAYKLHEMWVWNSNQLIEAFVGIGAKDVVIEYSTDGIEWKTLPNVPQLAQATGSPTYTANTMIDFEGALAQYVKLTITAGYGMLPQYGLSEVRFLYIPTYARETQPANAEVTDTVDVVLSWRAGREAVSHDIYLGTDSSDLALAETVTENNAAIGPLNYDTTYYWQIVEVNDAENPASYAGNVQRFTTPAYAVVDSFDLYDDDCNRIFFAWLDGLGHNGGEGIADCDVAAYNGNGTGSIVGHGNSPFAEQTIVYASSQSMPLEYDSGVSETTLLLDAQDWTASAIQSLSLMFYGAPANTGQLYLKINNHKISYEGLFDALQRAQWMPWNIDLAATGGAFGNVTSLSVGIEGAGGPGKIYVDEIRLYPRTPETMTPLVPDAQDPNLVAYYEFEGNANDSMGNYHGSVEGEPIYAAGIAGQAISFDGTDDYTVHEFAQEELWPAYCVTLWVRTDVFAQEEWRSMFNNNSSSADFQLDVDGTDPGNYRYLGSGTGILGPVSTDWVHLAVSCDGTQTRVFYNGVLATQLTLADTRFGRIGIGINRGLNEPFAGAIDDVRIYRRALSDAEVAGLAGITEPIPLPF
jgi:hypothetical protein